MVQWHLPLPISNIDAFQEGFKTIFICFSFKINSFVFPYCPSDILILAKKNMHYDYQLSQPNFSVILKEQKNVECYTSLYGLIKNISSQYFLSFLQLELVLFPLVL